VFLMTSTSDEYKTSWKSRSTKTEKPWGYELHWAALGQVHGKCLYIKGGEKTSLKYFLRKDEVLFLRKGRALIIHGDEYSIRLPELYPMRKTLLEPGESMCIQQGCPYRIIALDDCEIFEIGNNGDQPLVRVEDDYGRVVKDDNSLENDSTTD